MDDKEFQAVNATGNLVNIDMHQGNDKQHQSPTELLLSALSACASVDLVQILKKRRRIVDALQVDVVGERREDEQPHAFIDIKMVFILTSPDVEQAELEKWGHLAATRYCSVAGSLTASMSHEFRLVRPL